jgi:hypothetical protein
MASVCSRMATVVSRISSMVIIIHHVVSNSVMHDSVSPVIQKQFDPVTLLTSVV